MSIVFNPFRKLAKLAGAYLATPRYGQIERYFAKTEKVEVDIWPGGTHWQISQIQKTAKPTIIPNRDMHTSLEYIIKEKIVARGMLTWEETLSNLKEGDIHFGAVLFQTLGINKIVIVAVLNTPKKYLYVVKRHNYDPTRDGEGYTLLIQEKDLMNFYYSLGIDREDVPMPGLVDTRLPRPVYPLQIQPEFLVLLGRMANKLPQQQEDYFWGGRK